MDPIRFRPIFKELVWGGRKLRDVMGKQAPISKRIGESWELVDLPGNQSIVAGGKLNGQTLESLIKSHHKQLMGPVELADGRFPLLVKFIDAAKTLSVQVHPDEENGAKLGGRAKSEAWYILNADPSAELFLGLKEGVTREELSTALRGSEAEQKGVKDLLRSVSPKPGSLVPVRPGTLHAIGGGILLAEVQQPSDTTFRVYDWGRAGLDGEPRELHLDEAMTCLDVDSRPEIGEKVYDSGRFRIEQVHFESGSADPFSNKAVGPVVIVGLKGTIELIAQDGSQTAISAGEVVLLPHSCGPCSQLTPDDESAVLVVTFPSVTD